VPNGFKEPDAQIFLTGCGPKDPTLVLEVGYSEGLSDLRLDVRHWLSRTPPVRLSVQLAQMSLVNLILIQVLLVVLIDIKKPRTTGMPTVTVEHWRKTELVMENLSIQKSGHTPTTKTIGSGLIIYLTPSRHNSLLMVFLTI